VGIALVQITMIKTRGGKKRKVSSSDGNASFSVRADLVDGDAAAAPVLVAPLENGICFPAFKPKDAELCRMHRTTVRISRIL